MDKRQTLDYGVARAVQSRLDRCVVAGAGVDAPFDRK